jgi:hypothetical protein
VSDGAWEQDMPFTMVYGNGGLLTTVPDLLRWNDALSAGTAPLTREVVSQLETRGVLTDGSTLTYALGLVVDDYRGVKEVSHGGATPAIALSWPLAGAEFSVAILCNAGSANPDQYAHAIARIAARIFRRAEPAFSAATAARPRWHHWAGCGAILPTTDDHLPGGDPSSASRPAGLQQLTPLDRCGTGTGDRDFPVRAERALARGAEQRNPPLQPGGSGRYQRRQAAGFEGRYRSDELLVTYTPSVGCRHPAAPARPRSRSGPRTGRLNAQGRTIRFTRDAEDGHRAPRRRIGARRPVPQARYRRITMTMVQRPAATEYAHYYERYIGLVPDGDILSFLKQQRAVFATVLGGLSEAQGNHRYAPGKWCIKELICHVADAERVFGYRALHFARGDRRRCFRRKPAAPVVGAADRTLRSMAEEFDAVRGASVALIGSFTPEQMLRRGSPAIWRCRCALWRGRSAGTPSTISTF